MSDIVPNVVIGMPSQLFTMARSFKALANGKVYISKIDTPAGEMTDPANYVQVYLENEDGTHVPMAQPIVINAGGYPVYNGQIAKFVTVKGHSMAAYDSSGSLQHYYPNVLKYDPDQLRAELAQDNGVDLVGGAASKEYVEEKIQESRDEIVSELSLYNYDSCSSVGIGSRVVSAIDVFGDSTMWGAIPGNTGSQNTNNPPKVLQNTLANLGYVTTVNNRAIPGTTLDEMINGTDTSGLTFEQRISTTSARVIFCNHGINDNNQNKDLNQYRRYWGDFVNICRKYGKIPVIITANPNPPIGLISEVVSKRLKNYVDVAVDVAKSMKVDLVDNFYYLTKAMPLYNQSYLAPDGAHMTTLGYMLAGQNMAIPFVNSPVLKYIGDSLSLSNTTYFDTLTIGRQLNVQGEYTGVTLTGIKSSSGAINIPIIIDFCTDESTIAIYGTQAADATSGFLAYNGNASSDNFSGEINQKDTRVGSKFNAMYVPTYCNLTPGLHVIGVSFGDFSEDGKYLGLGGAKVIGKNEVCSKLNYNPIITRCTISGTFDWSVGGQRMDLVNKDKSITLLRIENDGTGIKATVDGVTTLIAAGSGGRYDYSIKFWLGGIDILIGSVSKTINISTPLPDMYMLPEGITFFKHVD